MRFIALLYRASVARDAAFLPLHEAAARLYDATRAADVLSEAGMSSCLAARLDYHARQLVHHAKYGKVTLYGKRAPNSVMEPIPRNQLWSVKCGREMSTWLTENSVTYTNLSLRPHDLKQVVRWVKRAVKDHDLLLAWGRRHASSRI